MSRRNWILPILLLMKAELFMLAVVALVLLPVPAHSQGSVIVRVEDPLGSHCIDASSEDVTIHVRRIPATDFKPMVQTIWLRLTCS